MEMEAATIVIVVIIVGVFLFFVLRPAKRRAPNRHIPNRQAGTSDVQPPAADRHDSDHLFSEQQPAQPEQQSYYEKGLKVVRRVGFEPRNPFNKSEYPVFDLLEEIIRDLDAGHRVIGQTTMGKMLGTRWNSALKEERDTAYQAVRNMSLDFLVINADGAPVLAVEYQGTGHDNDDAAERDEIKRVALDSASIPFLEIPEQYDQDQIKREIRSMLRSHMPK